MQSDWLKKLEAMVVNQSELSTHQPHSQGLSHLLDLEEGDRGGGGRPQVDEGNKTHCIHLHE